MEDNDIRSLLPQVRITQHRRPTDFMGGTGTGPVRGPSRKLSSTWQRQPKETSNSEESNVPIDGNVTEKVMVVSETIDTSPGGNSTGTTMSTERLKQMQTDEQQVAFKSHAESSIETLQTGEISESDDSSELITQQLTHDSIINDNKPCLNLSISKPNDFIGGYKEKSTTSNFKIPEHLTQVRRLDGPVRRPSDYMGGCGKEPILPRRKTLTTPDWLSKRQVNDNEEKLQSSPTRSRSFQESKEPSIRDRGINRHKSFQPSSNTNKKEQESGSEGVTARDELPPQRVQQVEINIDESESDESMDTTEILEESGDLEASFSSVILGSQLTSITESATTPRALQLQSSTNSFSNSDDSSKSSDLFSEVVHRKEPSVDFHKSCSCIRMSSKPNDFLGGYKEKSTTSTFKIPEHLTQVRRLDGPVRRPSDFMGGCGKEPMPPRRKTLTTPDWLSKRQGNDSEEKLPSSPTRSKSYQESKEPSVRDRGVNRHKSFQPSGLSALGTTNKKEQEPGSEGVTARDEVPPKREQQVEINIDESESDGSMDTTEILEESGDLEASFSSVILASQLTSITESATTPHALQLQSSTNSFSNSDDSSKSSDLFSKVVPRKEPSVDFHKSCSHIRMSSKPNDFLGGYKEKSTTSTFKIPEHLTQVRKLDGPVRRPSDFMGGCGREPIPPRRKTLTTPNWLSKGPVNDSREKLTSSPRRTNSYQEPRKTPTEERKVYKSKSEELTEMTEALERNTDSLQSVVVSNTNLVTECKDENRVRVMNKPNEYLGGYKEKSTEYKIPDHCTQVRTRSDGNRRPSDFMGGGGIHVNAPKMKKIDPSQVFGRK